MPALGDEFRSAREARGLTLSDVAEQIHIRSVYLNAIEHEEWSSIGAPVYVRGFIRTYARFLGLDGEALVAQFSQALPAERPTHPVAQLSSSRRPERTGPSPWAWIGVAVAFALVVFVGYEWWSFAQGGARRTPVARATAAPAQPTPVPGGSQGRATGGIPAVTAPPTPVPHHQLAVKLTQRSWLRVTIDGTTRVEGILEAGTSKTFTGKSADVRVGNAGGVVISVNGRPATSLGKTGDVAEQHYTL